MQQEGKALKQVLQVLPGPQRHLVSIISIRIVDKTGSVAEASVLRVCWGETRQQQQTGRRRNRRRTKKGGGRGRKGREAKETERASLTGSEIMIRTWLSEATQKFFLIAAWWWNYTAVIMR